MRPPDIAELVQRLADPSGRADAANDLARQLGAEALLVFARDAELPVFLPAPGFARTIAGGPEWRDLFSRARTPGVYRVTVAWPAATDRVRAVALSEAGGLLLVFLGGDPVLPDHSVPGLPLLAASCRAEMRALAAEGAARVAERATREASALMSAVDSARADAEAARAEALGANRAKDEFLAMLGHELRNPLAPIVTALQLLRMKGQSTGREFGIIERQVQHLVRLVDDLLDVARITRGKVELMRETLEIADPIAKAIEIASPLFEKGRHEFRVSVPESGLSVDGDRVRIAQVIANLLTNAARYTRPGGHISLRAERAGDQVVVTVRDDGIGIAADFLPNVFELFLQGARKADRAEGGLGLGLALVKNLTELHGGSVAARSEGAGKGSEFEIRLPLSNRTTGAWPVLSERPAESRARIPRCVVVVDDNVDAADLLGDVLRSAGHHVETAHDGLAAVDLIAQLHPEFAIVDIGLPVMDGYEVARKLRERHATSPRLIALTGYGQETDRVASRSAGFDAHLVKPVDTRALLALIDE